jgi:uncharacterized protein YjaG (DUF416 family)
MTILRFDRDSLAKELSSLPKRLRAAFAAACAQRLMPSYVRSASENSTANPRLVARILGDLWKDLENDSHRPDEIKKEVEICESLIPDYDHKYFEGMEYAEDAVMSLAYALDARLTGESKKAALAAEHVNDAVDTHVLRLLGIEVIRPGDDVILKAHPLIQAEYRRQRVDLVDLRSAANNPRSERAIITQIKRRAESDAAYLFRQKG